MPTAITGPEKIKEIKRFVCKSNLSTKELKILDVGGTGHTYKILKELFPKSEITSLNITKNDLIGCEKPVIGDAENLFLKNNKFDLIIANDLIEHLQFPDSFLIGCKKYLREGGLLLITTPNLACWYNRIFLLFGLSLANYNPSKYRVGNPFLREFPSEHKSVFTLRGLKSLLRMYSFRITYVNGFDYGQKSQSAGKYRFMRKIINLLLPNGLKEGILIVAKKEVIK